MRAVVEFWLNSLIGNFTLGGLHSALTGPLWRASKATTPCCWFCSAHRSPSWMIPTPVHCPRPAIQSRQEMCHIKTNTAYVIQHYFPNSACQIRQVWQKNISQGQGCQKVTWLSSIQTVGGLLLLYFWNHNQFYPKYILSCLVLIIVTEPESFWIAWGFQD